MIAVAGRSRASITGKSVSRRSSAVRRRAAPGAAHALPIVAAASTAAMATAGGASTANPRRTQAAARSPPRFPAIAATSAPLDPVAAQARVNASTAITQSSSAQRSARGRSAKSRFRSAGPRTMAVNAAAIASGSPQT